MSFLLDTHALLWWLFDDPKLSPTVRTILEEPTHPVWVSSASAWEIATKHRIGKLPSVAVLVTDIAGYVRKAGFRELPVRLAHAQLAGGWKQPHRDPFDRMLAAQAHLENLTLLSMDPALAGFGVRVTW
ncbi:MAG: type II toxin-antitoxin system VapC family toxin [Myxococcota bacterium]